MGSKANYKAGFNLAEELLKLNTKNTTKKSVVYDEIFTHEFVEDTQGLDVDSPKTLSIEEWEELTAHSDLDQ